MPFDQIANFVDRATREDFQVDQLRARFHNLVTGLSLKLITRSSLKARLVHLDAHFYRKPENRHPERVISALALSLIATDDHFKESDYYSRPGELSKNQDRHAVTFQRNQFGRLGEILLGNKASGNQIRDAFNRRGLPGARTFLTSIGAPDRALWLTPYTGRVEELCEEAQSESLGPARRAEIVKNLVSELGLCHVDVGDELVAFVTAQPIGNLTFLHPSTTLPAGMIGARQRVPVGPTPFEARDHRRYRNWPAPPIDAYGYGRTYALDVADRSHAADGSYGRPEAVRPRLDIKDFADCILLGTLHERASDDTDVAYLTEIGVNLTLANILRALHRQLGV